MSNVLTVANSNSMGNIGFKPLDFREKYTIYYYDSLSLSIMILIIIRYKNIIIIHMIFPKY